MRKLFLLGLIAFGAHAQSLSIGVLGGVPFSDALNSFSQGNPAVLYKASNYTIGPALQINLPLSLRLEVDALYRPTGFELASPFAISNISANQWRFPVLAQYRFSTPLIKPFVEAGLSFDHLSGISDAVKNISSGRGQLIQQSHAGFVLGGGVDVKIPLVRVSGELRYTRQGSEDFRGISNLNQAEFLVGIHF